ncbi:MAG: hypothetical protein KJ559_01115 [Nanoarchaeota archaeon]|nr:hypothetical protein [Nanoarchaeota archaeon]
MKRKSKNKQLVQKEVPQLKTFQEFELACMALEEDPRYDKLYISECKGCCCDKDKSSYRVFSSMPKVSDYNGHADTGANRGIMLAKVYNARPGLAKHFADSFMKNSQNLAGSSGIPKKAKVYKIKDKHIRESN